MHSHPYTIGQLASELGNVRLAEAEHERRLSLAGEAAVRGGAGGVGRALGSLVSALIVLAAVLGWAGSIETGQVAAESEEAAGAKVDADNYFVLHPGPAGGRSDADRFDPFAPPSLGTGAVLVTTGFMASEAAAEGWAPPPPLGRPGQPS